MVSWLEVLRGWGYPKAEEVAPKLEELGLDPEYFKNRKHELFSVLVRYYQKQTGMSLSPKFKCPDWLRWLCDFLAWLWQQIAPWVMDVVLIIVGGLATSFLSGWYRLIGGIPTLIGILRILKRAGVIEIPWLPA